MDDSFYDILASHYDDLQLTGDTSAWAPYICGLITEFCKKDFRIIVAESEEKYEEYTLGELLPKSFEL